MMGSGQIYASVGAVLTLLGGSAFVAAMAPVAAPAAQSQGDLLDRVKNNLQRERQNLLEYAYREKRRPFKVSAFGKVSLDEEHLYEVFPSADPDRPRRVLAMVAGRPATAAERAEFAKKQSRDYADPARRERRENQRKRAQERFDDTFRVFQFTLGGYEIVDGAQARVVTVTPRPDVETTSDIGKWLKRFKGTAWIIESEAELVKVEMVATGTISIGWGFVGRIAEGTTLTYERQRVSGGMWLPARARFDMQGRTLLFRSFDVDTTTEWFDYRPYDASAESASDRPSGPVRE